MVKKLFDSADLIINATDFDREGEVIFGYVYEMCHCKKPFQRAHFTSNTQTGIRDGFKNLKPSSAVKPMEMAGRARNIADWVVGSNLTAQTSLKHRGNGVLSIGRVQTPTLNMLVERELAIRNHKSEPFWTVQATFTTPAGEEYKGVNEEGRYTVKADAEKVLAAIVGHSGTVSAVTGKKVLRNPPNLYSLSALQIDANEAYGLTLAETLAAAQHLYEKGYTTYPRTDSQFLTDDMEPKIQAVLDALEKAPDYSKYISGHPKTINRSLFFDSSKVSSHFAIVPTGSIPASLTGNNAKVYDLIAKSVIRMIYPAAEAKTTKVTTTVNGQNFTSNGSIIVNPGWLAVDGKSKETLLPALKKGDVCAGEYELKEGKTEAPKPYTDGSLVAAMKTAGKNLPDAELRKVLADPSVEGIGREATRAAIIETLLKRGYAERKKKQLRATDLGVNLISMFPCAELKSPELTARWETRLSGIANGTESFDSFVADIKAATGKWCREIKTQQSGTVSAGAGTANAAAGTGKAPEAPKVAKTTSKAPVAPVTAPVPASSAPAAPTVAMKKVELFTDGACSGNPGPGGWGAILRMGGHEKELCGSAPNTTNNRMELTAVIEGLRALNVPCEVTVVSDSTYVVNAVNKKWLFGWERTNWVKKGGVPVLNPDLWQQLLPLIRKHKVTFEWIRGHAGHPENERCDAMAVSAYNRLMSGS